MPRPNTAHFPWHSLPIFWNVPESLTTQNVLLFFFFIIKSSEAIRPIWRPAVYILPCEDLTQINVVETIERRYHSNAIFWENICTNSRIHHPLPRLTPHFPYGWFSFWSRVVRVTSFSPVWSRWFSISSCPALILVLLRKKRGEKKKLLPNVKALFLRFPRSNELKKKTHKSTIVSRDPPMTRGAATDRGWWKYPERRRRRCCTFDRFISYVYRCETPARQVRSRHRLRSSSYEHSIARHASLDAFSWRW